MTPPGTNIRVAAVTLAELRKIPTISYENTSPGGGGNARPQALAPKALLYVTARCPTPCTPKARSASSTQTPSNIASAPMPAMLDGSGTLRHLSSRATSAAPSGARQVTAPARTPAQQRVPTHATNETHIAPIVSVACESHALKVVLALSMALYVAAGARDKVHTTSCTNIHVPPSSSPRVLHAKARPFRPATPRATASIPKTSTTANANSNIAEAAHARANTAM
eukprot:CAMPEP_0204255510 /NCGR_PEP_ID=MMETSP0468-20130131/3267_1 /ASSEMBLY_ACC=CAM_ASM_000383 /TAXON_ID=2969 /ORGANISM="Oxyrrhis marina" /LENGTH=224 /DNA_ID=CAMNT_0051229403 /DNA_START=414 /DNA_END=1088 /DNA_ORIENTATION=+